MAETPKHAQHIGRLTPLADVLVTVDRLAKPVAPRDFELAGALGRTLAADIVASVARPAAVIALRDGWAVRAEDTLDAGSYAPAILPVLPAEVAAGQALPAGADAVLPRDALALRNGAAEALASVTPAEGALPAGVDAAPGQVLRRAGERLRAIDLGALRALGVDHVTIRVPRLRILRAHPGDAVHDAAAEWLVAAVAAEGAIATSYGWLGADDKHLHDALKPAGADAIFIIGGGGVGPQDRSVEALARAGRVEAHGIGLSPGESAAFGVVGECPVLIAPGRIDATLAVFVTLGRRLIARLAGGREDERSVESVLTRKVTSTIGLAEVVPVRRDGEGESQGFLPLATGYLPHAVLAQADGFILVPADSEGFPAGARVAVRPLP